MTNPCGYSRASLSPCQSFFEKKKKTLDFPINIWYNIKLIDYLNILLSLSTPVN
ncbi:hypothetical protein J27TS7_55760 [Paenibacillus dendritiformis]|nr:hypothetical protein J27TS7_55760 [Paenibacillus dendritiformis]